MKKAKTYRSYLNKSINNYRLIYLDSLKYKNKKIINLIKKQSDKQNNIKDKPDSLKIQEAEQIVQNISRRYSVQIKNEF